VVAALGALPARELADALRMQAAELLDLGRIGDAIDHAEELAALCAIAGDGPIAADRPSTFPRERCRHRPRTRSRGNAEPLQPIDPVHISRVRTVHVPAGTSLPSSGGDVPSDAHANICSMFVDGLINLPETEPPAVPQRSLVELEREIAELAGHLAVAMCRWLLLIAEWDQRLGWSEPGATSCAQWLSWRCSIGLGTAREHVRVARRLMELPVVREAFAVGELSYSKVRAITRVGRRRGRWWISVGMRPGRSWTGWCVSSGG
jgi:hypothetical protein